jgi:hypothetical protein
MNWTHFLLWVAGIYTLYYLVNILIDAAAVKRTAAANSLTNELSFSELVEPELLKQEAGAAVSATKKGSVSKKGEPEVIAYGGVPMGDICNLARKNLINYTGAVSF